MNVVNRRDQSGCSVYTEFSFSRVFSKPPTHGPNNYKGTKSRLYWCLIEVIDWRYSQSYRYFRPLLWTSAPLTFSLTSTVDLPPLPVWISTGVCIYTVWNGGNGIRLCGEHLQELFTMYWTDQIPNLQNCFTTPNKNLAGKGPSDRLTPGAKSLYRWNLFGPCTHHSPLHLSTCKVNKWARQKLYYSYYIKSCTKCTEGAFKNNIRVLWRRPLTNAYNGLYWEMRQM